MGVFGRSAGRNPLDRDIFHSFHFFHLQKMPGHCRNFTPLAEEVPEEVDIPGPQHGRHSAAVAVQCHSAAVHQSIPVAVEVRSTTEQVEGSANTAVAGDSLDPDNTVLEEALEEVPSMPCLVEDSVRVCGDDGR